MKYKSQAISKIEKLENQIRALEIGLGRSFPMNEIQLMINNLKEILNSLKDTISIENDEWN